MKQSLLFASLLLALSSCDFVARHHDSVQGNENVVRNSRDVKDFHGINTRSSINIVVTQGEKYKVELEAEENVMDYIETRVEDGVLVVTFRNNTSIETHEEVTAYVTAPSFDKFVINGSGNITGEGTFKSTDEVETSVQASGNIKLSLDCPSLKALVQGSGDINLGGKTRDVRCTIQGSGNLNASEFKAENVIAEVQGSGNANVYASVKVEAKIQGSGNVTYAGNPQVSSSIQGSGTVTRAN